MRAEKSGCFAFNYGGLATSALAVVVERGKLCKKPQMRKFTSILSVALLCLLANPRHAVTQSLSSSEYQAVTEYIRYRVDTPFAPEESAPWNLTKSPYDLVSPLSSQTKAALSEWTFRHGVRMATSRSHGDEAEVSFESMENYAQNILDEIGITKSDLSDFAQKEIERSILLFQEGRLSAGEIEARLRVYAHYTAPKATVIFSAFDARLPAPKRSLLIKLAKELESETPTEVSELVRFFSKVISALRDKTVDPQIVSFLQTNAALFEIESLTENDFRALSYSFSEIVWSLRWDPSSKNSEQQLKVAITAIETLWAQLDLFEMTDLYVASRFLLSFAGVHRGQNSPEISNLYVELVDELLQASRHGISLMKPQETDQLYQAVPNTAENSEIRHALYAHSLAFPFSPSRGKPLLVLKPRVELGFPARAPLTSSPLDSKQHVLTNGTSDHQDVIDFEEQVQLALSAGQTVELSFYSIDLQKRYLIELQGMRLPQRERVHSQKLISAQFLTEGVNLGIFTGNPEDSRVGTLMQINVATRHDGKVRSIALQPVNGSTLESHRFAIDEIVIQVPSKADLQSFQEDDLSAITFSISDSEGFSIRYFKEEE